MFSENNIAYRFDGDNELYCTSQGDEMISDESECKKAMEYLSAHKTGTKDFQYHQIETSKLVQVESTLPVGCFAQTEPTVYLVTFIDQSVSIARPDSVPDDARIPYQYRIPICKIIGK